METTTLPPIGRVLRSWRRRRHVSQLDLASEAGVSTRHVSFIETGRARPSREMVLHLAEHLEIPLRERNTLLTAAGFEDIRVQTVPGWQQHIVHTFLGRRPADPARAEPAATAAVDPEATTPVNGIDMTKPPG
jgi:transcriptional regulator with XRE-family HTH domain